MKAEVFSDPHAIIVSAAEMRAADERAERRIESE
jgi:hypothetical protein